ncbi:2OG-Fe(II) oxygenase [Roseomonas alkaliterrae]|uniref:Putative 2-oxoglutarate/Fe(II)-dependent dioxygenase YbiX/peroxiredoxin n=1 Tax=Neoroseomonas alkaliterrae TaxID=1452450 RepID=A0A840Y8E3_9PROT|nr:2OG-Fe(II) oxygenase [Neoroseomonas alkaliterrae]MBB5690852.1 putative 2-oxoglutarate/Fe(II)-dependent dioxygenase YbiX/peroxiredoxin [Neoroseomonas alkaliterrae]MBR0677865.1 2OG-Fe(II) oxygenase [Neoroseomonas alkaliterrae]
MKHLPGDPFPWFTLPSTDNPRYAIHSVAGRYVLLGFIGSAGRPETAAALAALRAQRALFDDDFACFFGISVDAADREEGRLQPDLPGIRFLFDLDGRVSRDCGVIRDDPVQDGLSVFRSCWVLLDPMLRVIEARPLAEAEAILGRLAALPPPAAHAGFDLPPPILVLPRVFEPDFCRALIAHYEARGGEPSGFMREVEGRTVGVFDPAMKRRKDCIIEDEALKQGARVRILRRIVPEIRKVHHFDVTRMERYIVACYDSADRGHFAAHRDNTTSGTAHRRFAVTINLNAEEFEGGELRFPEYGPRAWKAPTGGAVVFSCSLLHQALPVTAGVRYAFLPFLYDEAAARLREANNARLGEGVGAYRAGPRPQQPAGG